MTDGTWVTLISIGVTLLFMLGELPFITGLYERAHTLQPYRAAYSYNLGLVLRRSGATATQ